MAVKIVSMNVGGLRIHYDKFIEETEFSDHDIILTQEIHKFPEKEIKLLNKKLKSNSHFNVNNIEFFFIKE